MWVSICFLVMGLALLAWGADRFVAGAVQIGNTLRIPRWVVGMTLVGFTTSLPEILVSLFAALYGHTDLALGNAFGSYTTNIGLVLGVSALVAPLRIPTPHFMTIYRMLLASLILTFALLVDQHLHMTDGLVLILGFCVLIFFMTRSEKNTDNTPNSVPVQHNKTRFVAGVWLLIGLCALLGGAHLFIMSATAVARYCGVNDLVIGLTIVGMGTSLPELAASIAGVLRQEYDIALGNALGSNVLGILAVTAMPGLVSPTSVPTAVLYRDFPVMAGITLLLYMVTVKKAPFSQLNRLGGLLLLLGFCGYLLLLALSI